MKILHCCLAAFYIDNYGYQENILPKMHKLQGHNVEILASTETYIKTKASYINPGSYLSENGISVTRIPYVSFLPHRIATKLRYYKGINKKLVDFAPDIIFLHDIQFLGVNVFVKYLRKNKNVKVYADSHTDYVNSARNWISKNILHRIVYKYCAQRIEPYVSKFYGTLPARNTFMEELYNIPHNKIELLELGVDDSNTFFYDKEAIRQQIRDKYEILPDDFIIISGGKIDERKNIHQLLQSILDIDNKKIKLFLVGMPTEDMKMVVEDYIQKSKQIIHVGWLNPNNISKYLFAADIAVFPGTHSVLWEQSIGCGLPLIIKRWVGIEHVDLGGNCLFLEGYRSDEIKNTILKVYNNKSLYKEMKRVSEEEGIERFSYSKIADRAIKE